MAATLRSTAATDDAGPRARSRRRALAVLLGPRLRAATRPSVRGRPPPAADPRRRRAALRVRALRGAWSASLRRGPAGAVPGRSAARGAPTLAAAALGAGRRL